MSLIVSDGPVHSPRLHVASDGLLSIVFDLTPDEAAGMLYPSAGEIKVLWTMFSLRETHALFAAQHPSSHRVSTPANLPISLPKDCAGKSTVSHYSPQDCLPLSLQSRLTSNLFIFFPSHMRSISSSLSRGHWEYQHALTCNFSNCSKHPHQSTTYKSRA